MPKSISERDFTERDFISALGWRKYLRLRISVERDFISALGWRFYLSARIGTAILGGKLYVRLHRACSSLYLCMRTVAVRSLAFLGDKNIIQQEREWLLHRRVLACRVLSAVQKFKE